MTDNSSRQPKGIPVGGQFAATAHSEPNVTLATEEGFFTEADNDPNVLANSPAFDGDTGDEPAYNFLADGGNGNGGLPPGSGGNGGSGDDDAEERKASQAIMTASAKRLFPKLQNARTISVSALDNGHLRVDDVAGHTGQSIEGAADALNFDINANTTITDGALGIPARHILGNHPSASIDAVSLIKGEIKIVGFGKLRP